MWQEPGDVRLRDRLTSQVGSGIRIREVIHVVSNDTITLALKKQGNRE